jgi:predicted alpha/beta superfamily hydrolase
VSWRSVQLREHEFFVRGVREPVRRMLIDDRWVDVWIPDITPSGLIVAHDGQNVFDVRAATHHQTWDAARAAVHAAARVGVAPPAVVGVWNGSTAKHPHRRGFELAPQQLMTAAMQLDPRLANWFDSQQMCGDEYQAQVADVIVPQTMQMIGREVPVAMMGASMGALATLYALGERPELYGCGLSFSVHWPFAGDAYQAQVADLIVPHAMQMIGREVPVAMMGASMGALATLYALGERPELYGCGLSFSVHWPFAGDALVDALVDHLPVPGKVRVWMQNGTNGLDASYAPYQRRAELRLTSRGYVRGRDYVSRVLRRSGHNERSWARRLPDAIEWWLRS